MAWQCGPQALLLSCNCSSLFVLDEVLNVLIKFTKLTTYSTIIAGTVVKLKCVKWSHLRGTFNVYEILLFILIYNYCGLQVLGTERLKRATIRSQEMGQRRSYQGERDHCVRLWRLK